MNPEARKALKALRARGVSIGGRNHPPPTIDVPNLTRRVRERLAEKGEKDSLPTTDIRFIRTFLELPL
jgi:hypothetical protein